LATITIGMLLSRSSPSILWSSLNASGSRFSSAESTTYISMHVSCMKLDQYLRVAFEPPTASTLCYYKNMPEKATYNTSMTSYKHKKHSLKSVGLQSEYFIQQLYFAIHYTNHTRNMLQNVNDRQSYKIIWPILSQRSLSSVRLLGLIPTKCNNYKTKLAPYKTDGRLFTTDVSANFKVTWHKN